MGFLVDAWSANKSASAQEKASKQSLAEQKRQFDLSRADQMPWLDTGKWALGQQKNALMGDWSGFYNAPDYQYALEQGLKTQDRSAASKGRLYSGGYGEDLTKFGQGLATQNYGNYMNRLAGLSNTGQTTASNLGVLGQNYANQYADSKYNAANARSSAYNRYGNAAKTGLEQVGSYFGGWW